MSPTDAAALLTFIRDQVADKLPGEARAASTEALSMAIQALLAQEVQR